MGNEVSTVGGAIATAATSVAAGVTFGQVRELNDAVVSCAKFTAKKADKTVVKSVGETVGHVVATAGTAVAAGVTFGQVKVLNDAVVDQSAKTGRAATESLKRGVVVLDDVTDSVPGVGHIKGGICHAIGDHERGNKSLTAASRTVGVVGGGVGGFLVLGPAGAFAGGALGGAAMDGLTTGIDSAVNDEYRPHGQIAAWTAVAKNKSTEELIEGIIGGVMTPIMDGLTGSATGKKVAQRLETRDLGIIDSFQNEEGKFAMDEVFDAQERIAKRKLPGAGEAVEIRKNIPENQANEAIYDGQPVPEQACANQELPVFRGDKKLLREGGIERAFTEGIEPSGPANDAFWHQRGDKGCKFISTSKSFGVAQEFGVHANNDFAVVMTRARNGVDINLAGDLLGQHAYFPNQLEIANFGPIPPADIQGILIRQNNTITFHRNPSYVPYETRIINVVGPQPDFTPVILVSCEDPDV